MKATEHYFHVVWYYDSHDGWSFESYWDEILTFTIKMK